MSIQEEMKESRCEQMGTQLERVNRGERIGQWDYRDRSTGRKDEMVLLLFMMMLMNEVNFILVISDFYKLCILSELIISMTIIIIIII